MQGYAAVIVNQLHPFEISFIPSAAGMTKVVVSFSYGGVFRTSPEMKDFHDLWRGRMPSPADK